MYFQIICVAVLVSSVMPRNVPNFGDLDEDEEMLFKAAYDTYDNPSYNNANPTYSYETEYHNYETEIPSKLGKLDLLKDGMWALKTKLKELKAFDKALAANLLLTKMQVKELLKHSLKPLKTHQHVVVETKPAYHYQPSPSYTQYEQPHTHYSSAPQYTASTTGSQYTAPASGPQYTAPSSESGPQYTASTAGSQYTAPASGPGPQYTSSTTGTQYTVEASGPQYTAQHYGPQQPVHDPYYGH